MRTKKSWWERNWYWAVPGGCLGCLGLGLVSCAALFAGLFGAMRGSEPFQEGLRRARSHPEVVRELGQPIRAGWLVEGNFDYGSGPDGVEATADLTVPLSGPQGKARLRVAAEKRAGTWVYGVLRVEFASDREPIDLLAPPGPSVRVRVPRAVRVAAVARGGVRRVPGRSGESW